MNEVLNKGKSAAAKPQETRPTFRVLLFVALLTIPTAIFWAWPRQKQPESKASSVERGDFATIVAPPSMTGKRPSFTLGNKQNVTNANANVVVAQETNLSRFTAEDQNALLKKIQELEASLAAANVQAANSTTNDLSGFTGTWLSTNTDSRGPIIRRVTISLSGDSGDTGVPSGSLRIHAWENDKSQAMDWGEVPLFGFGVGIDGQPCPFGFAEFVGNENQGGFYNAHKLFLTIKFELPGIWVGWTRVIAPSVKGGFTEEFMVPAK